eukprot:TRINITY_DN12938_c0_g1_i1.p1 TRINITY_DN12938_c0_g1~~TRINITY_DN12938_c0_g1_i1.p1  ORF type:complete len:300 (-),score=-10.56 TRINITY_DN12938_c0_g1_i1:70-969(-)
MSDSTTRQQVSTGLNSLATFSAPAFSPLQLIPSAAASELLCSAFVLRAPTRTTPVEREPQRNVSVWSLASLPRPFYVAFSRLLPPRIAFISFVPLTPSSSHKTTHRRARSIKSSASRRYVEPLLSKKALAPVPVAMKGPAISALGLAALLAASIVLTYVSEAEAGRLIYVGGKSAKNPWSKGALKNWRCPVLRRNDKLVFRWTKKAGLMRIPIGDPGLDNSDGFLGANDYYDCNTAGATQLVAESDKGSYTYTVQHKDWGPLFFIPTNKTACQNGFQFQTPFLQCLNAQRLLFCQTAGV